MAILAAKGPGSPPRIGVFIGFIADSFQRRLWRCILSETRARGISAICFFGHGLEAPQPRDAAMNVAYTLAGPENLDALIVLSSTVGNFKSSECVGRLIEDTRLPAVSIDFPLGCASHVPIDGGRAMRELVTHLVKAHGRRNFALVTGPEQHYDSRQREAAFREALAAEGLRLDERLFYRGEFYKDSGTAAVKAFLASGAKMDAIVCLNDYMASGALEELRASGLSVPGDIAVTGFDDVEESASTCPPLTTIAQPFELIGKTAVDMALSLVAGIIPVVRSLDCRVVLRRSCGCPPGSAPDADEREEEPEARLVGMLAEVARGSGVSGVLQFLDEEVSADPAGAPARLRKALSRLKSGSAEGEGVALRDQALAFLSAAEKRRLTEENHRTVDKQAFLRSLGTRLLGSFSLSSLARAWADFVGTLGFKRGYLVLFDHPWEPASQSAPGESRLVTAAPEPGLDVVERRFTTGSLLPADMTSDWGLSGWLLEPLTYQSEALGYVLVELGSEGPGDYDTLRVEMSTALKGAMLMEEVRNNERKLERLVERRTEELRKSNRDLVMQIEERTSLEREIQEISNRTMQSIGQDIHDDLCQRLIGLSMLTAVLESNLSAAGPASIESVREIKSLLGDVVDRSRRFARTLYPPALDEVGLVPALEDLVASHRLNAAGASVSLQVEGECELGDKSLALQVYRIAQEALANALRHSGSDMVIIRLIAEEGFIKMEIRDFGRGFGPDSAGKGMGMRIMRYRADSIGAGLEVTALNPGVCVSCSVPLPKGDA